MRRVGNSRQRFHYVPSTTLHINANMCVQKENKKGKMYGLNQKSYAFEAAVTTNLHSYKSVQITKKVQDFSEGYSRICNKMRNMVLFLAYSMMQLSPLMNFSPPRTQEPRNQEPRTQNPGTQEPRNPGPMT